MSGSSSLAKRGHLGGGGVGGGAGVGAEGGAGELPTHRKKSGSLYFNPAMKPVRAFFFKRDRTSGVFQVGFCSKMRAAPPDTWGQAIDVPDNEMEPVSEPTAAEMMLVPGAMISLQVPQLL